MPLLGEAVHSRENTMRKKRSNTLIRLVDTLGKGGDKSNKPSSPLESSGCNTLAPAQANQP